MTLLSGERQVAATPAGIRGDHLARYRFAAARLVGPHCILDAGCGIGYGARLLAEQGFDVHAWDWDEDAIVYGHQHYNHREIRWSVADICRATCRNADTAVAFEVLEHLPRPGLALIRFPQYLIASVPNECVVPKLVGHFPHRVRHYTPDAFECLLNGAGYLVTQWWSQLDLTDAPLVQGTSGRTLVAVCER